MKSFQPANWPSFLRRLRAPGGRRILHVDYRDRISVCTWLLVFALGSSLLLDLPSFTLNFVAFGSPTSITLGDVTVAALALAVLAGGCAESVVTLHSRFAGQPWRGRSLAFWSLPMALALIVTLLLPEAPSALMQVLGLVFSGMVFALAFFALYATAERGQPGYRRSRLLLDALAYGSALILFLFVYQSRTRSLVSGTLIAATSTLLAIELLRGAGARSRFLLIYGAVIGLVLGEVTWALNYWVLPDLTGGLLLLLIFYLLTGIAQQGMQERLTRRVLMEFALFAGVALILIALVGPGF